jgi:peptide/nickel transport system substrate-binding protein
MQLWLHCLNKKIKFVVNIFELYVKPTYTEIIAIYYGKVQGGILMKSKRILAGLLIAVMGLTTACGSTAKTEDTKKPVATEAKIKEGGNIVFAIGGDPAVLNPIYGNDRVTMTINNALFAPLYVLEGDKADCFLAESITPSADFLTYTLKLKKDLTWHDAKPITADDVIFTMEKILDKNQNTFLRDSFVFNEKPVVMNKVDDLTVDFKLPEVSMAFLASLSQVLPMPKHVFENEKDIAKSSKNEAPVGSGPFKFKEWKKGESVTLERFDAYVRGKAHLDTVVYRVIADANSSNIALQNGEIAAKYIVAKDVEKYSKDPKFNVVTYDEGMLNHMVFKFNNPSIAKKEVRQAISYAINKDELVKVAYTSSEYAQTASSIFTPNTLYYTNEVEKLSYNVEKSKELLAKSGEKNVSLKLGYMSGNPQLESQALVIQQNLKDIGITLNLLPMERGAFYKKLFDTKNKDFDLAFNGYVMGTEPDSYKGVFMTAASNNVSGYTNKEVDALWNSGAVEKDSAKRQEIYKQIQVKIAQDAVVFPIVYPKSLVAIDKKYGGTAEAKPVSIFMFQDLSKLYLAE